MNVLHWFWRQLWITVVFALVLLALYTSIGRQLMPILETKHTEVEAWLSAKLSLPVTMSSLQGDWQGLSPVLRIKDLNIAGEQGLTFKQVTAELNLSASIFYRTPVFERIVVSGTHGKITQISEQEWQLTPEWVVHFDGDKKDNNNNSQIIADWLVLQQYILLKDVEAQISTLDSQADSLVDSLNLRQLRWRSLGGQHELNVDLAWGRENSANIRVQAFLDGALWPWRKQHGRVYVNLEEQDWSSWLNLDNSEGFDIKQLQGSAQGWLNIRNGNLESVYLTSDITQVTLATANDEFTLSEGTLMLAGKHSNNDWHLKVLPNFSQQLPLSTIQLSEVSVGSQKAWQIGVPELDIQQARELLERYKVLPEKIALFIDGTEPNGVAKDIRLSFLKDTKDDQWKFDVRASLEDVHSTAFHGIPELSGVSAELHLQPHAGLVRLNKQSVGLYLPGLYTTGWQLDDLQADFRWLIFNDHAELQLENAQAKIRDNSEQQSWPLTAELSMLLPRHSNTEPSLSLLLTLPEAPVALYQLLVPELVGEAVLDWLEGADLSGQIHNTIFALQTEVGEGHPLNSSSSLLSLNLEDVGLTYLPEWPRVNKLSGVLFLDSPDLEVRIDSGETLGGRLSKGLARLHDGRLNIHTRVTADSHDAMSYFTATPLQDAVSHALDGWEAQGAMTALFDMSLDFGQEKLEPQIALQASFKDNQLFLSELNLELTKLTGKINYSSTGGLQSDLIEGHVLGGPFRVNLSSVVDEEKQLSMVLQGKGSATWNGFHQWQKLSIFEPIQGQLKYDVKLLLSGGQTELQVTSDLLGTEIKLPAPFNKKPDQPRSLKVQLQAGTTSILNANYDQTVLAEFALTANESPRGQIVLGGANAQLSDLTGIEIRGSVSQPLVFEEWWQSFLEMNTQASSSASDQVKTGEVIRHIDLTLLNLTALDVPLGSTYIQALPTADYWKTEVDSPVIKGLIDVPITGGPMRLSLDYLLLPELEAIEPEEQPLAIQLDIEDGQDAEKNTPQEVSNESDSFEVDRLANFTPNELPHIEATIKEFFIGGRNYGRWQLSSRPVAEGIEVEVFDSDLYGLNMQGKLQWLVVEGKHHTQLQEVQLKSSDVGAIQRGFRLVPIVEGKNLTGVFNLNWQGSPMAFNIESLEGTVNLRIRDGFLVTEEAKALKALGALNFKSVSRRLKLDFSDLYQEGVSFDDLRFYSRVKDNVLTLTEPMLVDGPGGKFLTSGHTNLIDHSLDMRVAITLPVTGNLPIVAILAGLSPPVAASIYITEKLIGDDLSRFTSASYSLEGTWEDPDMKIRKAFDDKVEGKETRSFKNRFLGIFGRGKD